MIDHAPRIARKAAQNQRIAEMERRTAPLFWMVFVVAAAVCLYVILTQPLT